MGYTLQQLKAMGATPGPAPTESNQSSKPAVPVLSEAPVEKKKYTLAELKELGATPAPVTPEPEEDGILKTIAKGIVKPVATMVARPIQAGAAILGADADQIDAATKKVAGDWIAPTPRSGTDVLKDVGRGIETVAMGAGTAGLSAGKTVFGKTVPKILETPGVVQLAKDGLVKSGIKEGAKYGAIGGFGAGVAEDPTSIGTIAGNTALGGVLGGAIGGTIPAVSKAFGKTTAQQAAKADEAAMVAEKAPDARVATKMADDAGKVVDDPIAREAVKQGLPEADVGMIKNVSGTDAEKMLKMLDTRVKGETDRLFGATNRASDVSGETGMNLARHIEKVNREAGEKLNSVAKALAGRKADPSKALTQFGEAMDGHGITIKKGGQLNFKGSDFEGVPSTQKLITNIWDRTMRAVKTGDAYQLHRLKTFIDENVSYGKQVEGLSGKAERLVKGLRRGIDEALDSKFPTYNKVNTQFSDTINEMNALADYLGVDFKIGKEFANMKMGTKLRGLMSNRQTRGEMLQTLKTAQEIAKKYGYKGDDDIVSQAVFSNLLEDLFGAEANTGFRGEIEGALKGVGDLTSAGADMAQGGTGLISGPIKIGKFLMDTTRGISQENKIAALRALLERNLPKAPPKTPSVFGKPKGPTPFPKGQGGVPKTPSRPTSTKIPSYLKGIAKEASGGNPGHIDDETYLFLDDWKQIDAASELKQKSSLATKPLSENVIKRLSNFRPDKPITLYRGVRPDQKMGKATGYESWSKSKAVAKGFGKVETRTFDPKDILVDFDKLPKWTEDINGNVEKEVIVKSDNIKRSNFGKKK